MNLIHIQLCFENDIYNSVSWDMLPENIKKEELRWIKKCISLSGNLNSIKERRHYKHDMDFHVSTM